MKWGVLIAALPLLAGCASEPMTDEKRQLAMQYLLAQQANQPKPYVLPMPAPPPKPTNCVTTQSGTAFYTNCY